MVNNMFIRAGAAHSAGAPIGAAWNVAQATATTRQATAAGAAFGLVGSGTGAWAGQIAQPQRNLTPQNNIVGGIALGAASAAASPVGQAAFSFLHALNTPVRKVGDYLETNTRYYSANTGEGSTLGQRAKASLAFLLPVASWFDEEWQDTWATAAEAQSSPMQTLWLHSKSVIDPDEVAPGDDPFRLLDDSSQVEQRNEYFGGGVARWATGIGDFALNVFADPLIVGGKVAQGVTQGLKRIKATDVAAAASGTTNLTRGGRRVESMVNRVAQAFEDASGAPGELAALSRTPFLQQSADSGAIAYFMRRLDEIEDPIARMAARKDALYAGMGHRPSLAALEAKDELLSLELQSFLGPNRENAVVGLLFRSDMEHIDNLRAAHQDDWLEQVVNAHIKKIDMEREALRRVHRMGSPSGMGGGRLAATEGVGELKELPLFATVGRSIHKGLGLPPVHFLYGRKLPNVIDLGADDAYDSFASAVMRTAGRFEKKSALDDEMKSLLDDFASTWGSTDAAASRIARRKVVDKFNQIQTDRIVNRLAGTKGPEHQAAVRAAIMTIRTKRNAEILHVQERAQRAFDAGQSHAWVSDPHTGVIAFDPDIALARGVDPSMTPGQLATPFAGTQTDIMVSIPDYRAVESALRTQFKNGWQGWMEKKADGVWRFTNEGLTAFDQLWKFAALVRPGYPVRNFVDTQARNLAMLGALDVFRHMGRAMGNLRHNMGRISVEDLARYEKIASYGARLRQIDDLILARGADKTPDLIAQRGEIEGLIKTLAGEIGTIPVSKKVRIRETSLARHIGMEGDRPVFRDAADFQRGVSVIDAKDSVTGLVTADSSRLLGDLRSSGQWQYVGPTHAKWSESYLEMVNRRVRNDRGLMSILAGADDDAIRAYYLTDPEGRAIWAGLKSRYLDVDDFIATQRDQIEQLIPEGKARDLAMGGPLTERMLDDIFPDTAVRPAVPREMLEGVAKDSFEAMVGYFNRTRAWWFKYAGEMPEEILGRLPFYVSRAKAHMDDMWPTDFEGNFLKLTASEADELYLRAGKLARRDVGRYLFDTAQRSNLSAHLRFLSPFYNAWSDTMRKWMRISGYNPAALPMLSKAMMSPNSMFTVVDKDGNRILVNGDVINEDGETIRRSSDPTEGYIVLPIPRFIADRMGADDTVRIAKSALNVTFQGEPFWLPSAGPLVTVPVNWASNKMIPELVDLEVDVGGKKVGIGRYFLPYGPEPSSLSQTVPMWMRNAISVTRAIEATGGDSRVDQTYATILATRAGEINRGEAEPMTQGELMDYAQNATRNWWIMRFMSNWMGFTAQPQSRMAFWQEKFRQYRREYGADADERFYQDYPDYYEATISLSVNETGIAATDETWNATQQYKREIRHNPEYGWMYVGAANTAPGFAEGVYTAQQAAGFRTTKNPAQAYEDTQVSRGWREYTRFQNAVNEELAAREAAGGPKSLTANANRDVKAIRDRFIADLKESNMHWANQFEQGGTAASVNEFFRVAIDAVADRPELGQRSDFLALQEYMRMRNAVRAELDARGLASIESPDAEDVAEIWDQFTSRLVESDIGFEQMWNRAGLDRDIVAR